MRANAYVVDDQLERTNVHCLELFYKEWQDAATELDYDKFHNYWPSLDFCEPEWDAEVTKWVSSQPYCTYLCE